jgi:hypothetical protein
MKVGGTKHFTCLYVNLQISEALAKVRLFFQLSSVRRLGNSSDCRACGSQEILGLDDSCASPFIGTADGRVEGEKTPTAIGLLFVGLVVRAILGAAIVVAVAVPCMETWKGGRRIREQARIQAIATSLTLRTHRD